jgi:hypothetical protein
MYLNHDSSANNAVRLDEPHHVLTIARVAKLLRIGRGTAYEHARLGLLPVKVIRSGGRMMVSTAEVSKLLGIDAAACVGTEVGA